MTTEIRFDTQLKRFLTMAMEIWPCFRSGLKHIDQIGQPHKGSKLPHRNYNTMNQHTFSVTIVNDLFDYIMNYDVTAEDIQDYLGDILELLMMEEQLTGGSSNPASYVSMSRRTIEIIEQLQQGKNNKLVQFEQGIYNNVKAFTGRIFQAIDDNPDADEGWSGTQESVDSDYQQQEEEQNEKEKQQGSQQEAQGDWQEDGQDYDEEYQQTQEERERREKREAREKLKAQKEARQKRQADLQDDGWTIVRKK